MDNYLSWINSCRKTWMGMCVQSFLTLVIVIWNIHTQMKTWFCLCMHMCTPKKNVAQIIAMLRLPGPQHTCQCIFTTYSRMSPVRRLTFFFFCLLQQQDKPTCPSFSFCLSVSLRGEMVKPTFFTFWLFSLVGPNPTSCPLGFVVSSFAWSCG